VPVGNLLSTRADFRELLSLPKGTLVVLDVEGVIAVLDDRDRDIWAQYIADAATAAERAEAEAKAQAAAEAGATLKNAEAVAGGGAVDPAGAEE
jgi:hypothetical protein